MLIYSRVTSQPLSNYALHARGNRVHVVRAVCAARAVSAVRAVRAVGAARAARAARAVSAVRAGRAVCAVGAARAVSAVRAVRAVQFNSVPRNVSTYHDPILCIPFSQASYTVTISTCFSNAGLGFFRTAGAWTVVC